MQTRPFTVGEIVAYNFKQARLRRGWSFDETAERLAPYVGARWTRANVAAIERSMNGGHRRIDVDDLIAFSRAFDLPLLWFFVAPPHASEVVPADPQRKRGQEPRAPVDAQPMEPADFVRLGFSVDFAGDWHETTERVRKLPRDFIKYGLRGMDDVADIFFAENVNDLEAMEQELRGLADRFARATRTIAEVKAEHTVWEQLSEHEQRALPSLPTKKTKQDEEES